MSRHPVEWSVTAINNGKLLAKYPDNPYSEGLMHIAEKSPETIVIWAHTGLGRFVKPTADHLKIVSEILDRSPNWYVDLSWDLIQSYIVEPETGMPTLEEWARFVENYQDRVLWGSDSVIFTKNKIDKEGRPIYGTEMPVEEYNAVLSILDPLWSKLCHKVTRKVRMDNHVRLFDAAAAKVRAWEKANAHLNVWNLPVNSNCLK
jgi:predicted TIM-barrel fold metal-dependent hydrolase